MMNAKYFIPTLGLLLTGLLIQSCTDSSLSSNADTLITSSTEILPAFSQKTDGPSPQKVYNDFVAMVEKVHQMNREEIEAMSDAQIIELGKPILDATEGTIKLPESTLQNLEKPLRDMAQKLRSMTRQEHRTFSEKVQQAIRQNREQLFSYRELNSNQVRSILIDYNDSGVIQSQATCSSLFNIIQGYIFLYPGDNLNLANDLCPAGSIFYVHSGTYYSQSIEDSKDGNTWVGVGTNPIVLDGQNSTLYAFEDGMKNNSISWLTIKMYSYNGIYSNQSLTKGLIINNINFYNIATTRKGRSFGAIELENGENIEIRHSYFENVASGIRFDSANGPLVVSDNEANNTGFAFLQCIDCQGAGIEVKNNSLEHSQKSGDDLLFDFINIYKSSGLNGDPITVDNNRARINNLSGVSAYGSFIILGDLGGRYQIASNNIGVTTGNAGIGAAGGRDIEVNNNKVYSASNSISNVAFYSRLIPDPQGAACGNHTFSGNIANWRHKDGFLNKADAPINSSDSDYCGLTNSEIRQTGRVDQDTGMGSEIWNQW